MGVRGLGVGVLCAVAGLVVFSGSVAVAGSCPNEALRTGASAGLPDCRAFEQVSPVDKGGFSAYPYPLAAQASPSGDAVSYQSFSVFPGAVGNTAFDAGHLGVRAAGGWQATEVTPPVPKGSAPGFLEAAYTFSEDLSQVVLRVPLVPLTPGATPDMENLFLRHPDGSYSLVNSAPPKDLPEALCGEEELSLCAKYADYSAFAGGSGDFGHILFESIAQFTPQAPGPRVASLYEEAGGLVRLVGYLPDGLPAATSTAGGGSIAGGGEYGDGRLERAISRDGSRVVFGAPADEGGPDATQNGQTEVYDRLEGRETIELSAPAPGASPAVSTAEPATFWAASADGSHVFFTSSAELTSESNTGPANNSEDLYEYNVDTRSLRDLSVDTNAADVASGAMVQGVVDASSDGAFVYFVADGQLVEGQGVDGQPNMYVVHDGGAPVFVATLGGPGGCNFNNRENGDPCDWTQRPPLLEAYVTPDGRHLAFMSTMSLPAANFPQGVNNTDLTTGQPDSEVYEYTAPVGGEAGRLVCASCTPSDLPPTGPALLGGISVLDTHFSGVSTPFSRVRALSDDGSRLFYAAPSDPFNKVYEYEMAGTHSCVKAVGCQYAISGPTGGSTEGDRFLGASADGNDVFFASPVRLWAGDQDNLIDVYDARVDGGFSPPAAEASCESECAQTGSSPPGVLVLASGFTGPSGNVAPATTESGPPVGARAKGVSRAQQRARALKACRAKHGKHRRAVCEASARKRYGVGVKSGSASKRGGK